MTIHRKWRFKKLFDELPGAVQGVANAKLALFSTDPNHPSLRRHPLARHPDRESISISKQYRAVFRLGNQPQDVDVYVFEWIGSHSDFDREYR